MNIETFLLLSFAVSVLAVAEFGQCGGRYFTGNRQCDSGVHCYKQDRFYAQCLTLCLLGWVCNSPLVGLNGQCGGND
jgi:hypothetical protein